MATCVLTCGKGHKKDTELGGSNSGYVSFISELLGGLILGADSLFPKLTPKAINFECSVSPSVLALYALLPVSGKE